MSEDQNIEYKESWRDEYLKWICGFANAHGGKLYIGIADDKSVVGVSDAKRLMEDIPNKIANVFYRAGMIESWGRGINIIRTEFAEANMQMPDFEVVEGGLMLKFKRLQPNGDKRKDAPQVTPQVTPQVQALMSAIGSSELSTKELMAALGLKDRHNFFDSYLTPAIEAGLVASVYPNQPRHPRQKYRRI